MAIAGPFNERTEAIYGKLSPAFQLQNVLDFAFTLAECVQRVSAEGGRQAASAEGAWIYKVASR